MDFKYYKVEIDRTGVATVTFDRPPVNAMGVDTYLELGALSDALGADAAARVIVLRAPEANKAWCAGADLKELAASSGEDRGARYQTINEALARFYAIKKPVIGALNGACLGMGMVLAALCDFRVAAEEAVFALPEVERGMAAPIGVFLSRLNMPGGFMRELLYTSGKYTAKEMAWTGFFNHILPRDRVAAKASELALKIATHRPAAIVATKAIVARLEVLDWAAEYKAGQQFSIELHKAPDASQEINSFLSRAGKPEA
ncbi:MAG: enoyl-CoA hydratase/isomerase family protein [Acetobacteraceae bacterium]|nr:enoyl-CoA hydratase/isomerase family protein [Acetobacteraceae bacterium]